MLRLGLTLLLLFVVRTGVTAPVFIDHDWLAKHKEDKGLVVIDMTSDNLQYLRFHIPGAVRLAYGEIVTRRKKDKVSVRVPDAQLLKVLGSVGIGSESYIIIYDDIGGLDAGRLFWELERIGHKNMSVLSGGIVSWVLAGHKVDNKQVKPVLAKYTSPGGGRDNEASLANIEQILQHKDNSQLLDVRSEEEYVGHPKYPRTGHIPGARWMPWDNNVDFDNGFVLRQDKDLLADLASQGITDKARPVVLYCRSGHRASQTYLTLRHLGFSAVKLYDGSMAEYEKQRSLPLVRGR